MRYSEGRSPSCHDLLNYSLTMQDVVLLVGLFNQSEWASPTDRSTDVTYRMRGGSEELWDRSAGGKHCVKMSLCWGGSFFPEEEPVVTLNRY